MLHLEMKPTFNFVEGAYDVVPLLGSGDIQKEQRARQEDLRTVITISLLFLRETAGPELLCFSRYLDQCFEICPAFHGLTKGEERKAMLHVGKGSK